METPRTLQQAIIHFSKPENCNTFMIAARWSGGRARCPQCGSDNVIYLEKARLFKCRTAHPKQKFSLKSRNHFRGQPAWYGQVVDWDLADSEREELNRLAQNS